METEVECTCRTGAVLGDESAGGCAAPEAARWRSGRRPAGAAARSACEESEAGRDAGRSCYCCTTGSAWLCRKERRPGQAGALERTEMVVMRGVRAQREVVGGLVLSRAWIKGTRARLACLMRARSREQGHGRLW
jgi:hypothetical protein